MAKKNNLPLWPAVSDFQHTSGDAANGVVITIDGNTEDQILTFRVETLERTAYVLASGAEQIRKFVQSLDEIVKLLKSLDR